MDNILQVYLLKDKFFYNYKRLITEHDCFKNTLII